MQTVKTSSLKSLIAALMLMTFAVVTAPAWGQQAPAVNVGGKRITSVVDDWSHHHVVFADPGTAEQAIQSGHYDNWVKIVNQPRYVLQQLKRGLPVQGPAAQDVANRYAHRHDEDSNQSSRFALKKVKGPTTLLEKDWSMALGPTTGGLAVNQYPAKFNFDTTTTGTCSDFAVFPTGTNGGASQATIVAYTSIYGHTTCPAGPANGGPNVLWAYNTGTGSAASLSPIISNDATGSQIAYVQTTGTAASLVLLTWSNSGGTAVAPTTPTLVTLAAYNNCTAPCYTTIPVVNGVTAANVTNSSPFYIYEGTGKDTLYLGDDTGHLHQYTGVFNGTPAETIGNGWPITLGTTKLTGAVYDPNSTKLFVGDAGGFLYSVTTTGTATKATSNRIAFNTAGIADAPLIDVLAATSNVYVSVGCDANTCSGNSAVTRFATGTTIAASSGTRVTLGSNVVGTTVYSGAFDNTHYTGGGTTGNLYVCGYHAGGTTPELFQIPMAFTGTGNVVDTTGATAGTCGPVTEFLGDKGTTTLGTTMTASTTAITVGSTASMAIGDYIHIGLESMLVATIPSGTTLTVTRGQLGTTAAAHATGLTITDSPDYLFVSVTGGGQNLPAGQCTTGSCLYNYIIGNSTNSLTANQQINTIAAIPAAGGTSGIIIDNASTTTGEAQIYYTTLATQACTGNGTTGNTTGKCAVQTLQSAP